MKVVFDTNVFRDVQRGAITPQEFEAAKTKLSAEGHVGCFSVLTFIELGSHIKEEGRDNYGRYRDAFKAAVGLCSEVLPDPEAFMREVVFGLPPDRSGLAPGDAMGLSRLLAHSETYEQALRGREMLWDGKWSRVRYKPDFIPEFREGYESEYVQRMYDSVLATAIPDYVQRQGTGETGIRMEEGPVRDKLMAFLDGEEFRKAFADVQVWRARAEPSDVGLTAEEAVERLNAFYHAYVTVVKEAIRDGYNVAKNKNDFNDFHFLIYLADPNVLFVSRDSKASRKVPDGSPQKVQIRSFGDWLTNG